MAKYPDTKNFYESDITRFLKDFDKRPEAHSEARRFEENKYHEVHELRDNPERELKESKIWKGF
ncbi:MAG: CBU_0585 family protein [Pseudomonadota bacterium]